MRCFSCKHVMVDGRCGFCGYNIRNKIYKIKSIPTLPSRRRTEKTRKQHNNLVVVRHYSADNNPVVNEEKVYRANTDKRVIK